MMKADNNPLVFLIFQLFSFSPLDFYIKWHLKLHIYKLINLNVIYLDWLEQ